MLIAANDFILFVVAIVKEQVIKFELTNHYHADFSPQDEFGVWFFRDCDDQWLSTDNFMMGRLNLYLKNGVIEADSINPKRRNKIQLTNGDVEGFLDEKIKIDELRFDLVRICIKTLNMQNSSENITTKSMINSLKPMPILQNT